MADLSQDKIREFFTRAVSQRKILTSRTNALRLINGRGDAIPGITLDRYNRHFLIQLFEKKSLPYLKYIEEIIIEKYQPEYLIVKDRSASDRKHLDVPDSRFVVVQNSPSIVH